MIYARIPAKYLAPPDLSDLADAFMTCHQLQSGFERFADALAQSLVDRSYSSGEAVHVGKVINICKNRQAELRKLEGSMVSLVNAYNLFGGWPHATADTILQHPLIWNEAAAQRLLVIHEQVMNAFKSGRNAACDMAEQLTNVTMVALLQKYDKEHCFTAFGHVVDYTLCGVV